MQSRDGARLVVNGQPLVSFASNDYLGLSQHPVLVEAAQAAAARHGVGATASPLVCGHGSEHAGLEHELGCFVGRERALLFDSGYLANIGLVPALVGRGDAVFSDALNHACLIDGVRLSRAEAHVYPHLDVNALARQLAASTARRKLVATDAVFSMDGDLAPLPALLALCERHDALLLIDDAHGFGVLGPRGEGSPSHLGLPPSPRLVHMATLSKAAGCAGGFVAGDTDTLEWLMQRSRSYVYSTATPAMVVAAARASLPLIAAEGWRRERLARHIARLRAGLAGLPWALMPSDTPIQPLRVGDDRQALALSAGLAEAGLWVPAIRPPTVPEGTARLRISLSAAHSEADVARLVDTLQRQHLP